jgi:hypothetical protein
MKKKTDFDFLTELQFPARERSPAGNSHSDRHEEALDEALGFTFPASDPIAVNLSASRAEARQLKALFINVFLRTHPYA